MASLAWIVLLLTLLSHVISGFPSVNLDNNIPDINDTHTLNVSSSVYPWFVALEPRKDKSKDPADFGWIKRWVALGESFTAGIGAGNLYIQNTSDKKCSRYDHSYPPLLEQAFGKRTELFQYLAYSGDCNEDIYGQIEKMECNTDFVVMTGGRNDLCLSNIINCICFPFRSERACEEIVHKAHINLFEILKDNVIGLPKALKPKAKDDGLLLYVLYVQFFNTRQEEQCGVDQDWTFPGIGVARGLQLTRRVVFNRLVERANIMLEAAIRDALYKENPNYRVQAVDWDISSRTLRGQFCIPLTEGEYPDPAQPNLQFFKPITKREMKELKKRELPKELASVLNSTLTPHNTLLEQSVNQAAEAGHKLDPCAPERPSCPGDDGDIKMGLGLPDRWGKFFHLSPHGHATIASFVMLELFTTQARQLGEFTPLCYTYDEFRCRMDGWPRYYATVDRVLHNLERFCYTASHIDEDNSLYRVVYDNNTPEQIGFELRINRTEWQPFNQEQCIEPFSQIIHGCDSNDEENPMNFKYSGRWIRDMHEYELAMYGRCSRNKIPLLKPSSICTIRKTERAQNFTVCGFGFARWDHERLTVLAGSKDKVRYFELQYYNNINMDGMEWIAQFELPLETNRACIMVPSNAVGGEIPCKYV
ncbi:hypothetical protein EYZ11_004408 [Aspergillus tanneri]|uniref:SGNH hydrolase-type esterase domain-containing protein n=1 Tax=Aspergillus tanneri TaxID=1220188 RepID=A0A4V3UPQ9_9EURO|nr:hypothetical protein EYZ11_004408 [Aspergillus tanneri]